jgi:drug/metabolite transporter (DMT)-like permease
MLVIFLSVLILEEEINLVIILGTLSIIFGVWLVVNKALDQRNRSNSAIKGIVASLGTTICWGVGIVLFKIILRNNDSLVLTAGRMVFLLPTLALLSIIPQLNQPSSKKWTKNQVILALFSGLLALGIGDTLLYVGLVSTNINIIAPLTSITPVFSAIIAILFLGEQISKKIITGTLLVTVGTLLLFL